MVEWRGRAGLLINDADERDAARTALAPTARNCWARQSRGDVFPSPGPADGHYSCRLQRENVVKKRTRERHCEHVRRRQAALARGVTDLALRSRRRS